MVEDASPPAYVAAFGEETIRTKIGLRQPAYGYTRRHFARRGLPVNDSNDPRTAAEELLALGPGRFSTILADPPWQFTNRTGKMAPEHRRLARYSTMTLQEIFELPVAQIAAAQSHLYLWVPNALVPEGLEVMKRWGFAYKTNLVWYKVRKDGGPDGRGVGFYFRNVTEIVLFGVRGRMRTLKPGRTQVNLFATRKREHSRKPDEQYDLVEACSPAPYLELFARHRRDGWTQWGNEIAPPPPGRVPLPFENEKTGRRDLHLVAESGKIRRR
jgi:N6-adenosine-specific RNA methylase IME4